MTTALVTGASRGLGLETCRQLAARGLDVLAGCRDVAVGQRAIAGAVGRTGSLRAVALDVTDAESVRAAAALVASEVARLEVLVNNAGVSLDGFDATVAARTLATNFEGAVRVTDAFSHLVPRGGRIVMVSSGMGELACVSPDLRRRFLDPALSRESLVALVSEFVDDVRAGRHAAHGWPSNAYRVSKVAMNAFTRIAARELAARGVVVNAVCPGWVRTELGGDGAPRSVEEGARGIAWAATEVESSGGFFRDGRPIPW